MMKETNIQPQVTSTIAGRRRRSRGEKSEENAKKMASKKPNEGLKKTDDAGWYVAVVRVNCETRIADSIRINLNHNHVWFDYWIPKVKVVYLKSATKPFNVLLACTRPFITELAEVSDEVRDGSSNE